MPPSRRIMRLWNTTSARPGSRLKSARSCESITTSLSEIIPTGFSYRPRRIPPCTITRSSATAERRRSGLVELLGPSATRGSTHRYSLMTSKITSSTTTPPPTTWTFRRIAPVAERFTPATIPAIITCFTDLAGRYSFPPGGYGGGSTITTLSAWLSATGHDADSIPNDPHLLNPSAR